VKIECGLGVWMVTLLDHEGKQRTSFAIAGLAELLPTLERVLGAGKGGWSRFKSYRKKGKEPKKVD